MSSRYSTPQLFDTTLRTSLNPNITTNLLTLSAGSEGAVPQVCRRYKLYLSRKENGAADGRVAEKTTSQIRIKQKTRKKIIP